MGILRRALGATQFIFHTLYRATLIQGEGERLPRGPLVRNYLKVRSKHFLTKLFPKLPIQQEELFGYRVRFFDYFMLASLYETMFVNKDYYFETNSAHPLVLDCGSNFGLAVLFMKVAHPGCRVIAFEPDATTFQALRDNVERNGWKDVELHNQAVARTAGTMDFYHDPQMPGWGLMSLHKNRGPQHSQKVEAVRLSDFVNEEVDFLKMDIEGAETEVLEELAAANKLRHVKAMVIEYHHHIEPCTDQMAGTLRLLEENGFGYEMAAYPERPMRGERFLDVLLYAYRK